MFSKCNHTFDVKDAMKAIYAIPPIVTSHQLPGRSYILTFTVEAVAI